MERFDFYVLQLLIFNRTDDLCTMLQHTSSYQAIVDDLIGTKMNRVTITVPESETNKAAKKTYDLNVVTDVFFKETCGKSIPDVIELHQAALTEVAAKETAIRSKTRSGTDASQQEKAQLGSTKDLITAVDSLPKLMEQKRNLDMHTNVLQAIMDCVMERETPYYNDMEEKMVTAGSVPSREVLEMVREAKGTVLDKLRLLAVYFLVRNRTTPLPYPTLPYPSLAPYPTLPYPTLPYPTLPYPACPSSVGPFFFLSPDVSVFCSSEDL
jgi:hypothetical protein